jgi:hypothetical protein
LSRYPLMFKCFEHRVNVNDADQIQSFKAYNIS